jgi:hypothetical protein
VKELSAFLKEQGLKCSGKKADLIERIIDNFPNEQILNYFKTRYFVPTKLGAEILDAYPFLKELFVGIKFINWTGQRCDLWRIFSECDVIEESSLSDIARQMGIKVFSTDGEDMYFDIDIDEWTGETQTFKRVDGDTVSVPVSPFLDRDCDLYDFDYEPINALFLENELNSEI